MRITEIDNSKKSAVINADAHFNLIMKIANTFISEIRKEGFEYDKEKVISKDETVIEIYLDLEDYKRTNDILHQSIRKHDQKNQLHIFHGNHHGYPTINAFASRALITPKTILIETAALTGSMQSINYTFYLRK